MVVAKTLNYCCAWDSKPGQPIAQRSGRPAPPVNVDVSHHLGTSESSASAPIERSIVARFYITRSTMSSSLRASRSLGLGASSQASQFVLGDMQAYTKWRAILKP
jgi:hypothetical protein